jgi:oxalyl-CoA decarboxylase
VKEDLSGGLEICLIEYRADGIHPADDPAPTVLMKQARYDKLIEAFGGVGYYADDPQGLTNVLRKALASGKPSLIDCAIDPNAGTESGHIGNLNPQSNIVQRK